MCTKCENELKRNDVSAHMAFRTKLWHVCFHPVYAAFEFQNIRLTKLYMQ